MRQHTPGPWLLENRGYKFIVSKPGDGYITRDVCRMDGSTMAAFEQEANAKLMAAAPDLLAALIDMTAKYERLLVESRITKRDAEAMKVMAPHYTEAARAAIAKAGG